MARRPPDKDPEEWRQERERVWARRNTFFNVAMLLAIALVISRYCS